MKVIHLPTAKGAIAHSRRVTALKGTHAGCDHPMQLAAQKHTTFIKHTTMAKLNIKKYQSKNRKIEDEARIGS